MKRITFYLILTTLLSQKAFSQKTVFSSTYVIEVQKYRKDTRFTLTEWLRIKERMKLMDVWLAMFSSPKKDRFRPELNLTYGLLNGSLKTDSTDYTEQKKAFKGQLWMTNLITSTIGIKTLNIDLGIEGAVTSTDKSEPHITGSPLQKHWALCLRLFGKHSQDSSLILKAGQYESKDSMVIEEKSYEGKLAGAQMSLYVFKWLGLETNYLSFGHETGAFSQKLQGTYQDYLAYIEISLLRLIAGRFLETWQVDAAIERKKTSYEGVYTGLRLQF